MLSTDLLSKRKKVSVCYLIINIISVLIVYAIPDSLIYTYFTNGQSYIVIILHLIHIISMVLYYISSWRNPGFVDYLSTKNSIIYKSQVHPDERDSFCEKCQFIRPLESKHCHVCNRCVIKVCRIHIHISYTIFTSALYFSSIIIVDG